MILILVSLLLALIIYRVVLSEPYTDAKKVVREPRKSMRAIKAFFLASFALIFEKL